METRSSVALTQVAALSWQVCLPTANRSELGRKGVQAEDKYGNDCQLNFSYYIVIMNMALKHEINTSLLLISQGILMEVKKQNGSRHHL